MKSFSSESNYKIYGSFNNDTINKSSSLINDTQLFWQLFVNVPYSSSTPSSRKVYARAEDYKIAAAACFMCAESLNVSEVDLAQENENWDNNFLIFLWK